MSLLHETSTALVRYISAKSYNNLSESLTNYTAAAPRFQDEADRRSYCAATQLAYTRHQSVTEYISNGFELEVEHNQRDDAVGAQGAAQNLA